MNGKGTPRRDRPHRRPPVDLRGKIGAPGVAVKTHRRGTARPGGGGLRIRVRLEAQYQPIARSVLHIKPDGREQCAPQELGFG